MKKSLQILFGFMLILVLAYVSFLDVSSKIKDDLLIKAKTMFSDRNVRGVSAEIKGEGFSLSRTLVLRGTAISKVEIERIVTFVENIKGVCSVDNQIVIHLIAPKAPLVPKMPTAIEVSAKPVKSADEKSVLHQTPMTTVSKKTIEVPIVPTVEKKSIVVPMPVQVIDVPKVIEVEKIKLEGVK